MGALLTYLWWGGNPDIPNPVSGLTQRDIYNVQKTWALAYKDRIGTGMELMKRFFDAYPENRNFFQSFKDMGHEEMQANNQFRAHVVNLMTALNNTIEHLAQPDIVTAMMTKLGDSHAKRKITSKNFNELKEVLVKLLIDAVHLNKECLLSWDRTVTFLYKIILPQLETTT